LNVFYLKIGSYNRTIVESLRQNCRIHHSFRLPLSNNSSARNRSGNRLKTKTLLSHRRNNFGFESSEEADLHLLRSCDRGRRRRQRQRRRRTNRRTFACSLGIEFGLRKVDFENGHRVVHQHLRHEEEEEDDHHHPRRRQKVEANQNISQSGS